MKNLKRALSFALATVMVIGMMVVGAGAAFTDADKIVNDEAVDTMVTLGVLNGKGDGSYFDPTGTLTRAEAAKIIVYVLHGGKAPVIGTKAEPTYTDIKGSWAESYIEYCSSLGIIAGKGDGTFGPTETLTGSAFAKMLMVAMGYKAEVFGFTGNDWEMNVNIEANKIGLYEELDTIDPTAKLSRDDAAQMAYNAIFAGVMEKSYSHNLETGVVTNGYNFYTTKNLYATKFGGAEKEGTLTDVTYDSTKEEYVYTVSSVGTVRSTKDYTELFQLPVTVLWNDADKGDDVDATEKVYGLYTDAEKIVEGVIGDLPALTGTDEKVKFNNVEYKLTETVAATEVYAFLDADFTGYYLTDVNNACAQDKFVAYDITDDGEVDMVVWYPTYVEKVNFAGKENMTISGGITSNYETDKDHIEAGLAKDDYVLVIKPVNTADGKYVITKAPVVSGKVTATNGAKVQVNGTWYEKKDGVTANLDSSYDMVVVNGQVCKADAIDNASKNLLVATKVDGSIDTFAGTVKVKVMFVDGTTEIVAVSKVDTATAGTVADVATSTNMPVEGVLYTYEIEDGEYELKATSATNKAGYDKATSGGSVYFDATADKLNVGTSKYAIADDAIVFINYGTKSKVVTGKALKEMTGNVGGSTSWVLMDTVNGYDTAKVIALNTAATTLPGADGDDVYGYITSDIVMTKEGDDTYANFTVWTNKGAMTVKEKTPGSYAKADFVMFDDLGDGVVDNVTKLTLTTGAIKAYDGDDNIKIDATDLTINGADDDGTDTVILYVDYDNTKGIEGGEIVLADEVTSGTYYNNAMYLADGSAITLLVIDVTNEIG